MKFSKWRGLGGDFIITVPDKKESGGIQAAARSVCDRKFGVGADGLVTLRQESGAVFEIKAYDQAGRETALCGNAVRCAGLYLKRYNMVKGNTFELKSASGVLYPEILGDKLVRTDMGPLIPLNGGKLLEETVLSFGGKKYDGYDLNLHGNHTAVFVHDIRTVDMEEAGGAELFAGTDEGRRIEFAEIISKRLLRLKVWRAFDGKIHDCGISSCAAAAAGALTGRTENNISVLLDDGELQIEFENRYRRLYMTGPAYEICSGVFNNFILKQ